MLKYLFAFLLVALPLAAAPAQPTRFTVTVEGEGPDLILIPGLASGRWVWDQAVAGLNGRYRVHRVQIAGFGSRDAGGNAEGPLLAPIVEELHTYIVANRLRRPILVGHSLGGLLTLMLADRHPEDVSRAMIVDALPFYGLLFDPNATSEGIAPGAAQIRDSIAGMEDDVFQVQQAGAIANLVTGSEGRAALMHDAMASNRGVVARAIYEDAVADLRPRLPSIRTPLTIVYAVNHVATEARFGALIRASYATAPDVRFVAIADSYHFVMLDQPGHFQAALQAFLSGRRPR
jgi:pimeloyl-ACP methyl ester carboxylesterase